MQYKIINQTTSLLIPLIAKNCSSYLCRLKGLMFSKPLSTDQSLLLVMPSESILMSGIHMVSVTYDIGVVWLNNEKIVVDKKIAKKWVSVLTPENPAKYVLEFHPSRIEEFNIGDKIQLEEIK